MQQVVLGRTGLSVSRLALGGLFVKSQDSELADAKRTVARAVQLGVNYIDTAPGYGDSEEVLGHALAEIDAPVVVSTKLGGRPSPFDPRDADGLKRSVDQSLKNLGRDQIEILMVHEPDRPGQYDWWEDFAKVEGPVLDVMLDLQAQGVIKHLGLGGTGVTEMTHLVNSGKFDVLLTAFNYSLLYREAEAELLAAAKAQNVGVIVGSPLQQGAFAGRFEDIFDDRVVWLSGRRKQQFRALYDLQDELGLTMPELALRFVISNPDIACVLMGARSEAEVEQNCAAVEAGPLPQDALTRLDEISAMLPYRPYEEPAGIGWFLRNPFDYKGPGELG